MHQSVDEKWTWSPSKAHICHRWQTDGMLIRKQLQMLRTNPFKLGRCWEKMESICRLVLEANIFVGRKTRLPWTAAQMLYVRGETNKLILWKMHAMKKKQNKTQTGFSLNQPSTEKSLENPHMKNVLHWDFDQNNPFCLRHAVPGNQPFVISHRTCTH